MKGGESMNLVRDEPADSVYRFRRYFKESIRIMILYEGNNGAKKIKIDLQNQGVRR